MAASILIFEDNHDIAREIEVRLRTAGFEQLYFARNITEAFTCIRSTSLDLALLDIEVPGHPDAGLDVAAVLRQNGKTPFIFLTGFLNKRYEAFELQPAAFLVKPFGESVIPTIELVLRQHLAAQLPLRVDEDFIYVNHNHVHHKLAIEKILALKADTYCVEVLHNQGKYIISSTLDYVLEQIGRQRFIQVHRSHAINLQHLDSFSQSQVVLSNGSKVSVSKSGYARLKDRLKLLRTKRKLD